MCVTVAPCVHVCCIYEKQDRLQQSRVPRSIGFAVASLNLLVHFTWPRASLVAQMVKNMPTMQETRVPSLGQADALGKEMATHSSILV